MMRAPILFVAHGAPTLALETGHPWSRALHAFGTDLPARAVLVISAHWWTPDLRITASPRPETWHDFSGFPEALHQIRYPCPGDPALAGELGARLRAAGFPAQLDPDRPLDHGAWGVMTHLRPGADLPVLQLSLPRWEPSRLLALGQALAGLRSEGVALLASGGLVHHLGRLTWGAPDGAPEPWAAEAEAWVLDRLARCDVEALSSHRTQWPWSREAAPTTEHLDPLFVALGAADGPPDQVIFRGFQYGSLSLASLAWM